MLESPSRGGSGQGGLVRRGLCSGGSGPGGVWSSGGLVWGVSARGGGYIPACTEADPPPVDRQMPVKILPWPNFVAAGKDKINENKIPKRQLTESYDNLHVHQRRIQDFPGGANHKVKGWGLSIALVKGGGGGERATYCFGKLYENEKFRPGKGCMSLAISWIRQSRSFCAETSKGKRHSCTHEAERTKVQLCPRRLTSLPWTAMVLHCFHLQRKSLCGHMFLGRKLKCGLQSASHTCNSVVFTVCFPHMQQCSVYSLLPTHATV